MYRICLNFVVSLTYIIEVIIELFKVYIVFELSFSVIDLIYIEPNTEFLPSRMVAEQ